MMENCELNPDLCCICQDGTDNTALVRVGEKGLNTILEYCKQRSNPTLATYLQKYQKKTHELKVLVHGSCRRDFTNPLRPTQKQVKMLL